MNDDTLMQAFAEGTLDVGSFDHVMHVRVAWTLLQRLSPEEALLRTCRGLRRLAERAGRPEKFHATITWAYVALIEERRRTGETFDDFRARCPELFDGRALGEAYPLERLHDPRARRRFLLPPTN